MQRLPDICGPELGYVDACTGLFVEAWWGLLVSVLGDVLFELGFWWKKGGRVVVWSCYRVCECG